MLIVQKLYVKEFLRVLLVLGLGIAAVFSIISMIDKIDELLPYGPPAGLLLEYTVLTVPKFIHYLLPMAILLSSLFVFTQAIRRMEIVAIKASGGKMKHVLMPIVGIGVILTLFGFIIAELIVPVASKRTDTIKDQITKRKKGATFKSGTLYVRAKDGSVVRVALYLPDRNLSQGVSIFRFTGEDLKERIDAETATWQDSVWKLEKVTVLDMTSGTTTSAPEMAYQGIESQELFQENLLKVETMTLMELVGYRNRLKEAGFRNQKVDVDISSRISYPLINFFMLLLGIALALGDAAQRVVHGRGASGPHAQSAMVSAGLGLLISLVYWFGHSFFLSLGYAGTIPPVVAPWVLPAVFAVFSIYLYRQITE